MLALGLYRAKGTLGSSAPYLYTNPEKQTVLTADDAVVVLKHNNVFIFFLFFGSKMICKCLPRWILFQYS
jgi:hypothetical protein